MKCISYNKPFPLYHFTLKFEKIRVCQDCGHLETCHGPKTGDNWRHIILHPDYNNFPIS